MRSESLGGDVSDGSTTVAGDRAHSNSKWRLGTRSTWQPGGGIYIRHTHSSSTPGARVAGRTGRAESSQPRLSPGILPAQVKPRYTGRGDRGVTRKRDFLCTVEATVVVAREVTGNADRGFMRFQRPDCIPRARGRANERRAPPRPTSVYTVRGWV